jgi:hypothetical protein
LRDGGDQGGLSRRIVCQEPRDRLGRVSDKFSPVPILWATELRLADLVRLPSNRRQSRTTDRCGVVPS